MKPPPIIAHRTCMQDAPENSLAGIYKAAALGADGVEIDLRLSLDRQPFLMHDNTMGRTTGLDWPLELTPAFVIRKRRLRPPPGIDLDGPAEPVPDLSSVLDALPSNLFLAVDVKTPWAIAALVNQVRERQMESRVLAWCQSALACRYVTKHAPAIEVAYLNDVRSAGGLRGFIDTALAVGARAISAHWLAIDGEFVERARSAGLKVYSWHQQYELTAEKLQTGLDALITDYPKQAREAYAALA